jgi:HK97 family phage prohead protease
MILKDIRTEVKDIDDKGIVTMYVSAFGNRDSDDDIIQRGAYAKTISENMRRIKHLKNHRRDISLGLPLEMTEDDFGLKVVSAMNLKKEVVRDTYEDYKFHASYQRTMEHSVAIEPVKYDIDQNNEIRTIPEVKLAEYSTLDFWGANDQTPMVDIKSEKDAVDVINMLDNMLRKGNYTDERFQKMEQTIKQLKALISNEPSGDTHENDKPLAEFYKSLNF